MTTSPITLEAQLLEAQRDALLGYFLGQVVVHSPAMAQHKKMLKDVDSVYDYLLLDVMVSTKVTSSRVALATNSVQQYLNRISLNIEPGLFMTAEESDNWLEFANRYNYWSADRLLRTYPESYVEPMLRLSKTEFFFQLESSINQGKITDSTVQQAILGYLNNFEDVSNLEVIASYQDGIDITKDSFYFVGRTRTQPYQYYWRSLDFSIRHPVTQVLSPNAWGEWKPINLPLDGVTSNTIRPIFMNNRLYITWLEIEEKTVTDTDKEGKEKTKQVYRTQIKIAYAKYDGTWSTPSLLNERVLDLRMTDMLAIMDTMFGKSNAKLAIIAFEINPESPLWHRTFSFICDTLLVRTTDLPDDQDLPEEHSETKKYAGGLVWYYAHGHDTPTFKLPYRSLALYPATRNSRWPIGGESIMFGSFLPGAGNIELVVEFVPNNEHALQLTARSDFILSQDGDNGNIIAMVFNIWKVHPDGTLKTVKSQAVAFNEPITDMVAPNIDIENYIAFKFRVGFVVYRQGADSAPFGYINSYKIATNLRPLVLLKEQQQVQYLDLPTVEGDHTIPDTIRLNTLFAKELIKLANLGVSHVLSWATQNIRELPLPPSTSMMPIDFNGSNGIYFWELFFHMPLLIAWRLNIEQRLQEATRWLHFIFNPLEDDKSPDLASGKPRYWCAKPLIDRPKSYPRSLTQPTDPDAIAASEPIHYRKAVFRFYLKNLIDQGDKEYRKLTPTSRIVARLIYASANALLGSSPDTILVSNWVPRTLQALSNYKTSASRHLELNSSDDMALLKVVYDYSVNAEPSDLFLKPVDTEYLKLWELLGQRLYNLRHNLTLDGKEFPAGLFDEPISPRDLLKQRYQRVVANRQAGAKRRAAPNYRFAPILSRAKEAVETLIQYGNTLLSLLERKDGIDFERFRMHQQLGLYSFTRNLQQQTIELNRSSLESLSISRRASQERQQYYQALYDENISDTEQEVIKLQASAANLVVTAQAFSTAGAVSELVPNIFGFSVGGMVFGGILRAISEGIRCDYEAQNAKANSLSVSEGYRRRQQEWELQSKEAEFNVEEINQQIVVQNRQLQISITQLAQIEAQQQQEVMLLEYFSSRFTNEGLYMWMISQLSGLYLQAYDAVTAICLSAEASWQYETGQYDTTFIQSGGWNDLYQGLLVGETLKLALQRMDQEFLKSKVRRLEIVKTLSVKSLVPSTQWKNMISTGVFTFTIDGNALTMDYPNILNRRIKTVAVTLPSLLGPYEDVRATLIQVSNSVDIRADLEIVEYWLNPNNRAQPRNLVNNLQTHQSVAISSGLNDSGMFNINFDDDMFLPFEGTGAASSWKLVFGKGQDKLLESLSDIIIHLRYTGIDGGSDFEGKVKALIRKYDTTK